MKAVMILVMLVLATSVDSQSWYACWGGCYNMCFIGNNGKSESENFACDYMCLNSCVPRNAADFEYYCQIGCSLKRCTSFTTDGARLEECFGWCNNLCNGSQDP